MNTQILRATVILFATFNAYSASFDCKKAGTFIEKAICADATLSALDKALGEAYQQAIHTSVTADQITYGQREWLKNVRNKCQDTACLQRAYTAQMAVLKSYLKPPTGSIRIVIPPVDNETPNEPNKDLRDKQQVTYYGAVVFGHNEAGGYYWIKQADIEATLRYIGSVPDDIDAQISEIENKNSAISQTYPVYVQGIVGHYKHGKEEWYEFLDEYPILISSDLSVRYSESLK